MDHEVIFRTVAELSGAIALEKSLERQRGQAAALGKDTSALDEKIATVNGSIRAYGDSSEEAGKQVKKAMELATHHGEHALLNHRALHQISHALAQQNEFLGIAFRAAFNPMGGAVMAVVGALMVLHKMHEKEIKLLKEESESADKFHMGQIEGLSKVRSEVGKAAAAYADWYSHLHDDSQKRQSDLALELALIGAQSKADEAFEKSKFANAEAELKRKLRAGEITQSQFDSTKSAMNETEKRREEDAADEEEKKKIAAKETAREKAKEDEKKSAEALNAFAKKTAVEQAQRDAEIKRQDDAKKAATDPKNIELLREDMVKKEKARDSWIAGGLLSPGSGKEKREQEAEAAKNLYEKSKNAGPVYDKTIDKINAEKVAAEKAFEFEKEKHKVVVEFVKEQGKALDTEIKSAEIAKSRRQETRDQKAKTDAKDLAEEQSKTPEGKQSAEALNTLIAIARQPVTAEGNLALRRGAQEVTGFGVDATMARKMFAMAGTSSDVFNQDLARLIKTLQENASVGTGGALAGRVSHDEGFIGKGGTATPEMVKDIAEYMRIRSRQGFNGDQINFILASMKSAQDDGAKLVQIFANNARQTAEIMARLKNVANSPGQQ